MYISAIELKRISMSTEMIMQELAAQEISIAPQSAMGRDDLYCSNLLINARLFRILQIIV